MLDPPHLATVKLVTGKSGDDEFEAIHRDLTEAATTPGCTFRRRSPRACYVAGRGSGFPKSSAVGAVSYQHGMVAPRWRPPRFDWTD